MENFFQVKKRTLLAVAGLVWVIAGFNVTKMGIQAYFETNNFSLTRILLSLLIFTLFALMFFKMSSKHHKRILNYTTDKKAIWHFFDLKAYLIMFFMMSGGILLRSAHLVPLGFIAYFYTGLGIALTFAGVMFWYYYLTFNKLKSNIYGKNK